MPWAPSGLAATPAGDTGYNARTMRILITADLHYDIARSREPAERLAERVRAEKADALVLVGDTAGIELDPWRQCLALFDGFPGRKLLVPGNHCLWCREGETTLDRYERVLPQVAAEAGFTVLDHQPVVLGTVGFRTVVLFHLQEMVPGVQGCLDVVGDRPVMLVAFESLICDVRKGTAVRVIVELVPRRLVGQQGAKWVEFVYDENAVGFEYSRGFGVVLPKVGEPHCDTATGVYSIEGVICQRSQFRHIRSDERHIEAERACSLLGNLELPFGYVNGSHVRAHPGKRKHNFVVAAG